MSHGIPNSAAAAVLTTYDGITRSLMYLLIGCYLGIVVIGIVGGSLVSCIQLDQVLASLH